MDKTIGKVAKRLEELKEIKKQRDSGKIFCIPFINDWYNNCDDIILQIFCISVISSNWFIFNPDVIISNIAASSSSLQLSEDEAVSTVDVNKSLIVIDDILRNIALFRCT